MENLKVTPGTTDESCIFFVWPLDIVHVIDEDSPFYEMSAAQLTKERLELLLVMEGTNETSNMTFQARSVLIQTLIGSIKDCTWLQDLLLASRDSVGPQV